MSPFLLLFICSHLLDTVSGTTPKISTVSQWSKVANWTRISLGWPTVDTTRARGNTMELTSARFIVTVSKSNLWDLGWRGNWGNRRREWGSETERTDLCRFLGAENEASKKEDYEWPMGIGVNTSSSTATGDLRAKWQISMCFYVQWTDFTIACEHFVNRQQAVGIPQLTFSTRWKKRRWLLVKNAGPPFISWQDVAETVS